MTTIINPKSASESTLIHDGSAHLRGTFARYIPAVHQLEDGSPAVPAAHHMVIAALLQDNDLGHTAIIAPPSHAKTYVAGVFYPAWRLGNDPSLHIAYVGNSADKASDQSMAVRDTIEQNVRYKALFPHAQPNKAKGWAGDRWFLKRQNVGDKDASFKAVGVGGDLLGSRADLLILDDVMDEENSATAYQRTKLSNWVARTAMTRLKPAPQGRCILIMTRWHEDDLIGWAENAGFTVVHMQAMSETKDVYATIRRDGQIIGHIFVHDRGPALWPEVWNVKALDAKRREMGSHMFAAVYQGTPVPEGGAIFQSSWWRQYKEDDAPIMQLKIQSWDTAFQDKQRADWSVCTTWGLGNDNKFYLLDMFRDRMEFPALKRKAQDLYHEHMPSAVIIEERASGQALIQELLAETEMPVIPFRDKNIDKVMRAHAVTGYFESGVVKIPTEKEKPWVEKFKSELEFFPNGTNDDIVDSAVQGVRRLASYAAPPLPTEMDEPQDTILGNVWGRLF